MGQKRRDKILDRHMITVVKLNALGEVKITYEGEVIEQVADGVVIQAYWTLAARDLGYTRFEPGDRFIEYYYTRRWYNIFDIARADGTRKGWYCKNHSYWMKMNLPRIRRSVRRSAREHKRGCTIF